MRSFNPSSTTLSLVLVLVAAFLALVGDAQAQVQIYTTTIPVADGNTIVVSQSVDALGDTAAVQTISTIFNGGGPVTTALTASTTSTTRGVVAPTTTTTTDPDAVTVPTTTSTTSSTRRTTTTRAAQQTTTTQAVVGQPGETAVSSTSYYWYTSDGVVYSTYFSPTFQSATVAQPVSSGTILDYSSYMSSVAAAGTQKTALASGSSSSRAGMGVELGQGAAYWLGTLVVGVAAGAWFI